jgi:hypothetical protein
MTFQSFGDFVCKEQQLTVQLESEQFWNSLKNTDFLVVWVNQH